MSTPMSTPTPGISGDQIKDHSVERHDLNTTVPGQAVVERLIAGTGITLSSTGADSGTGDVTISATGGGAGTGSGGSGSASAATASAFGTVETDITENGGSVVYTKTTMDSLLAGKISVGAAITESEITGLLMDLGNKVTAGTPLPESEITNLVSDLAGKIAAGTALPESEITGLLSDLAGKMAAGAVLPESEISNLAADLAARLVVAGTPAVGQVPVVTSVSPLAVQWQTPPGGSAPAAIKRRLSVPFYPAAASADTSLNLGGAFRFPSTSGGAAANWKLMNAALVTDPPNANQTTVQLYSSAGGAAAFGAGTACLSSPLSSAGASTAEVSTTSFAGSLSTSGLPTDARAASQFTALGCVFAVLWTEWEEV